MSLCSRLVKLCWLASKVSRRSIVGNSSSGCCWCPSKPSHLICFKQWDAQMVMNIINSAISLKCSFAGDTHCKQMNVLQNAKIMILQEINEPFLNMAVSKAATFLGAYDVNIIDHLVWDQAYAGRVFSFMADAIFVLTTTHMCVQRFADQSSVPVLCMKSRTHATIQALATVMAIIEEFGAMQCVNIGWVGPPHPVLNSYLLLSPMLGANIKFKCCCDKTPVSPLLYKASEDLKEKSHTVMEQCTSTDKALEGAFVVISGPSPRKEKLDIFKLKLSDIPQGSRSHWIYFHTCPRGPEVEDELFYHCNSRTFESFKNMQFIAAALMANAIKGVRF